MSSHQSTDPALTKRGRLRRLALGTLAGFALIVVVWAALPLVGLRVMKVQRLPAPLVQVQATEKLVVAPASRPRNLILFIADGFGFTHLSAARVVLRGIDGESQWDRFSAHGWHRTSSTTGLLTDSAASATALSTGIATYPGAIGVDRDGEPQPTLLERAKDVGYRTGIVTDSYVWDATPAAFAVHHRLRQDEAAGAILGKFAVSPLDLLVGELEDVGEGEVPGWEASRSLLAPRFDVLGPQPEALADLRERSGDRPIALLFEEDQVTDLSSSPNLPDLAMAAVDRLAAQSEPFVLLVECEEADSASHDRNFGRLVRGLEAMETTLERLLDFAERDGETLVVFTADHETGGLALGVVRNNLQLEARWATSEHTGTVVPLLASGPGAELLADSFTNWQVGRVLASLLRDSQVEKAVSDAID